MIKTVCKTRKRMMEKELKGNREDRMYEKTTLCFVFKLQLSCYPRILS